MRVLKPCPCGKTPGVLVISEGGIYKYATVTGDCCSEWMIEFRTGYHITTSDECMLLAIVAWNSSQQGMTDEKKTIVRDLITVIDQMMVYAGKMCDVDWALVNTALMKGRSVLSEDVETDAFDA